MQVLMWYGRTVLIDTVYIPVHVNYDFLTAANVGKPSYAGLVG